LDCKTDKSRRAKVGPQRRRWRFGFCSGKSGAAIATTLVSLANALNRTGE
jgi:hypothetical protein